MSQSSDEAICAARERRQQIENCSRRAAKDLVKIKGGHASEAILAELIA
jgi:hypothetical protein